LNKLLLQAAGQL